MESFNMIHDKQLQNTSNLIKDIKAKKIKIILKKPISIVNDRGCEVSPINELGPLSEEFPIRVWVDNQKTIDELSCVEKGDATCRWVFDIIKKFDIISEIVNFEPVTKHVFDILIRLKGDIHNYIHGIQVRTLSIDKLKNKPDLFNYHIEKDQYPKNTLMIYLNNDRNRFLIGLSQDIECEPNSVTFEKSNSNHKLMKFIDIELLKNKLIDLIPQSAIVMDIRKGIKGQNDLKSYDSVRRIQKHYERLGCKVEYENTIDSTVDIYINGHACQCKSTSERKGKLFKVSPHKTVNGITVPYEMGDFDYLIVQIINKNETHENDIYTDDICVIPIDVLVDHGHIKTNSQKGHTKVMMCPPRHHQYHWAETLWNNHLIIMNNIKTCNDSIYQFSKYHGCEHINTHSIHGYTYVVALSNWRITNQLSKYFMVLINDSKTRLYKNKVFVISKTDMFTQQPNLLSKKNGGSIHIAPPDYQSSHWSLPYWIDISDLDNIR
jgi:hypothetical protein